MADGPRRVIIAVTESASVLQLWHAAQPCLSETTTELVALFLANDRWHRAAKLPVTREISRIGARVSNFTVRRADRLSKEAVQCARRHLEQLAAQARRELAFEVLSESDEERFEILVAGALNVLVAPSSIAAMPIYTRLAQRQCRVVLVETTET